jgi:hypothetical protein
MDDKRLETIWNGFTHAPLGLGEMEALRFIAAEATKNAVSNQKDADKETAAILANGPHDHDHL